MVYCNHASILHHFQGTGITFQMYIFASDLEFLSFNCKYDIKEVLRQKLSR